MKSLGIHSMMFLALMMVVGCSQDNQANQRSEATAEALDQVVKQEQPNAESPTTADGDDPSGADELALNSGAIDVKGYGESSSGATSAAVRNFNDKKAAFLRIHGACFQHQIYATVGLSRPAQSGSRRYRATRTQRLTACSR